MKLVSIDALTRQNQTAATHEGWSEMHLTLRTMMENSPTALAEFNSVITPRVEEMLKDRQVVVIDEGEVLESWHKHGLRVPKMVMSPIALALTQPDGSHVILFNVKGLREHGTGDLEQVVIHELTHIRQLEEGRLTATEEGMFWNGERYCPHTYVQQTMNGAGVYGAAFMQCLLPWELEAYTVAYDHAVDNDLPSTNRQLTFVLACQRAYHNWRNGADPKPCDYDYLGQVLSPYGYSRICIADREIMRNALLGDMTNMMTKLELVPETIARETAHLFLSMDMEKLLRVFLGYGIHTDKTTGFFKDFFESFPSEMFQPQALRQIKEMVEAGK